ncbi:hypothetical protein HYW32_04410 [Candidatus Berkelbacteria bacterium]|nr:hypothetical protein [Candidatus Berkelbacteria bacterium]
MNSMSALFVVIDGTDGAGKDTQTARLAKIAKSRGFSVATLSYPSTGETFSGRFLRRELFTGKLGEMNKLHPKLVAYPFIVDRYEQQPHLKELIGENDLVIANRYVISTIAYQGAGLPSGERLEFHDWVEELDYEIMGSPREDAVIFLSLPIEQASKLLDQRKINDHSGRDLYDESQNFQREVFKEYQKLCASNSHWHEVKCNDGGRIRSIEEIGVDIDRLIFDELWLLKK